MPPDFDPSQSWPAGMQPPRPVPSHTDFSRLEERLGGRIDRVQDQLIDRIDKITDALQQLIALQSEIGHQDKRIDTIERHAEERRDDDRARDAKISGIDAKLERWINRGVGAWAVAALAFAAWEKWHGG